MSTRLSRLAVAADFEAVYSIYMHADVVPYLGFDPMSKLEFQPVFAALLASGEFRVVEQGGGVSGFYRVSRRLGRAQHVAFISTLAIAPPAQGSGLALGMLGDAIEALRALGVSRVELTLEADNPRALAFYRKLGFAQEGVQRAAFKRATDAHFTDELAMARLL